jgi:predicted DNA-binding transcriptional regulator AlpA
MTVDIAQSAEWDRLLNEHEVSALLNIAVPTLRRWRWVGCGPRFVKIGRAVRYEPGELRRWIAAQTRCSTSDAGTVVP